jgi:hypothetical protein
LYSIYGRGCDATHYCTLRVALILISLAYLDHLYYSVFPNIASAVRKYFLFPRVLASSLAPAGGYCQTECLIKVTSSSSIFFYRVSLTKAGWQSAHLPFGYICECEEAGYSVSIYSIQHGHLRKILRIATLIIGLFS